MIKNTRQIDLAMSHAPIRMARVFAEGLSRTNTDFVTDFTGGTSYGQRRPATWAEKRAMVAAKLDLARAEFAARTAYRAQMDQAEAKFGAELATLRSHKRDIEQSPGSANRLHRLDQVSKKIAQLVEAAQ